MIRFLIVIMLFVATQYANAQQAIDKTRSEPVGKPFLVHGRLSVYNGNPSCRIWIVGTKRILGIHEVEEEWLIPSDLLQILKENLNDRCIYADFLVLPLTEYREGVMQIVRFESAENVVVTDRHGHFLRKVSGIIK
jgi:hypothetical protein